MSVRFALLTVFLVTQLTASVALAISLPEAVQAGDADVVDRLLENGAEIDAVHPTYHDATALMIAAGDNEVELVQRLLAAGAGVNLGDKNGDTALNWAVYSGHYETAQLLLEAGADPRLSGHGDALQIALRRGHEELVQVLSVAMEARVKPGGRDTMLMLAVYQDDPVAALAALENGAGIDARDDVDRPLLHVAARLGHGRVLNTLLENGADVEAIDHNGFTALMVAAREGHAALVEALLASGARADARAEAHGLGLTPLHLAAIGGDVAIVRALAAHGANLDAPDVDGAVPALWALSERQLDCVLVLLDLGADATRSHKDGESVASLARRFGIAPVLEKLE